MHKYMPLNTPSVLRDEDYDVMVPVGKWLSPFPPDAGDSMTVELGSLGLAVKVTAHEKHVSFESGQKTLVVASWRFRDILATAMLLTAVAQTILDGKGPSGLLLLGFDDSDRPVVLSID